MKRTFHLQIDDPVVISQGKAGDNAWGHTQFPFLYRATDGNIIAKWEYTVDDIKYAGTSLSAKSNDGGKSWTEVKEGDTVRGLSMPNGKELVGEVDTSNIKALGRTPCEPHAIELDDGQIICHIRAQIYGAAKVLTLYQTESSDGGKTWTEPKQIIGDLEGAPSHILKHSSGVLIATYGHREPPYGIKVTFSHDGGESWSESSYLYDQGATGDLGYPSTVELTDGSLLTVFYSKSDVNAPCMIFGQKWRFED